MGRDPVTSALHYKRPLRDRMSFWAAIFAVAIGLLASGISGLALVKVTDETKARTSQLQDVICDVYVPIGNAPLSANTTELGRTLVAATRHGAVHINCPGLKGK